MNIFDMDADALRGYIRNLRSKQDSAVARSQAIIDKANSEGRAISAGENESVVKLATAVDNWENEVRAAEDEIALRELPARASAQLSTRRTAPDAASRPGPRGTSGVFSGSPMYAQMFPEVRASGRSEFANLGDFASAVWQRHPRLFDSASGMGEGVGADGAFWVPTPLYAALMDNSLQQEVIRPGATIIPMTSATVDIPAWDLSNRSTGIATLEGKVTAEGATGTTQKAKTRISTLRASKVQVLVPATLELLQDAPQLFGQMLQVAMTDALAQTLDTWFISGTGVGTPLGILNSDCLVTQTKESGQAAATLLPANFANMVSRLASGSWQRSIWIVSPSALAQLFVLTQTVKNVAASENVGGFQPNFFSVLPDGKFALLGRPLVVSDRCSALGTKGDVILADLSSYLVGVRQGATLEADSSIGFKESEVWFRLNARIAGQPWLASAITPRVGSATLSPFVTLEAR